MKIRLGRGRMRQVSTWPFGGVVALVGMFTIQQASSIDEESRRRQRVRSIQGLSNLVALWEGLITDRIANWAGDLAEPDTAAREHRLRSTVALVRRLLPLERHRRHHLALSGADVPLARLLDHPCLESTNRLRVMGRGLESAVAFDQCTSENPSHGAVASVLAARTRLSLTSPHSPGRVSNRPRPRCASSSLQAASLVWT